MNTLTTDELMEYFAYKWGMPGIQPVFPHPHGARGDIFCGFGIDEIQAELKNRMPWTPQQHQRYGDILRYY